MNGAGRAGRTEATLPVAVVARRLGIAPSTLRTWDRRYGLGPTGHTGGKHRRYGPEDVDRLELMQRALLAGASTAEAARYALEAVLPVQQGSGERVASGEVVLDRSVARRLRAAALAMDGPAVQRTLAESIAEAGVLEAWENVIEPVATAFESGWDGEQEGADAGYLFAECVLAALVRATPVPAAIRNQRPVLITGLPAGRVNLPLYALTACLAERRISTRLFGTTPPREVLAAAVRHTAPAAVVLHAGEAGQADTAVFVRLSRGRLRTRLFAWGAGWAGVPLPPKVEPLTDLLSAAESLEYVL
ncbi:MerR family transcriptional regulator, partial [Amycolatopsis rhizosphaerae]